MQKKEGQAMEDQLIIELFFKRSENAITELDKKYGKLCRLISRNILKNEEDAKECVNDTYFAVWNAIPPENPRPLQTYICKITRNLSLKKYHRNTAQKRNSYYDVVLEELAECMENGQNVEQEILAKELAKEISCFLGKLKTKERVIFVLRYWYSFSTDEIAERMKMTTNAVTVQLYRTREKLKRYLKEEERKSKY